MAETKQVSYINKDFGTFKQQLINFAKTYYPNSYNDFSEASPGMMFIEQASYVGDVLAFYADSQIQENFVQFAKQKRNLLSLAYQAGYEPKVTSAASTIVEVYQIVPSTVDSGQYIPDFNYSMIIQEGMQLSALNNPQIGFYCPKKIDFTFSASFDPTIVSVFSLDSNNNPAYFLLQKETQAVAGTLQTSTFNFGNPIKFPTVTIDADRIIGIVQITDSDNNKWYEVPYLAQETIFVPTDNTVLNDPNLYQYRSQVPYLLKLMKVPRRFVKRFRDNNTLELQFGAGISNSSDEEIVPNPENVGLGLPYGVNKLTTAYDPSNFLYTKTYGIAPSDITLTVQYLTGGGAESNVPQNQLQTVVSSSVTLFGGSTLDAIQASTVLTSLAVNNLRTAVGGGDGDSNDDLRLNTMSAYPTQLRAVTKDDYLVRALSLPAEYGVVSKAYITQEMSITETTQNTGLTATLNPLALSLFILSKDNDNRLNYATPALKQNLKTFLDQYRILTDAIVIRDPFIINIGVNFEIVVRPSFNNKLVLNNCLATIRDFFLIDRWQINQPIILPNLYTLLDTVEGVQTVQSVNIVNLVGENQGYSKYSYDMNAATIKGIIYPSLDPSIFEIRYPNNDIQGKVVTY